MMEDKDLVVNNEDFVNDEDFVTDEEIAALQKCKAEQTYASQKVEQVSKAACESKKEKSLITITRTEGILMFIFTVLLICVLCFVCNKSLSEKIKLLSDDLCNLEVQMAVLNQQITDKKTEEKEPVNVIVNIDGNQVSVGDETEPTEPTDIKDFDESPFLGVSFLDANQGQQNPIGLQIDYVYESSPAHLAGIKAGDIIMSVNGYEIKTLDHLTAVLAKCKAKDVIDITVASATEAGIVCNTLSVTLTYRGNFDLD